MQNETPQLEPTLTSEVQADGTAKVVGAAQPTNAEFGFEETELGMALPEVPTTDALRKLFTPRYVLNVTAPDGTVIPFVYKRVDPGTLLITQGIGVAVPIDTPEQAAKLRVDMNTVLNNAELSEDERKQGMFDLMNKKESQDVMTLMQALRRATLKAAVLSPQITDELYDMLDDSVTEKLYDCITGGVTSQTELVETFPDNTETPAE